MARHWEPSRLIELLDAALNYADRCSIELYELDEGIIDELASLQFDLQVPGRGVLVKVDQERTCSC